MEITEYDLVHDDLREECWQVYRRAFEPLQVHAVQRHLMVRDEFDAVMADKRLAKLVVHDGDGTVTGIAAYTNHLDAVPLVSAPYFAHRWPQEYADGLIWYVAFLAVDPQRRRTATSLLLVSTVSQVLAARGGILGVDICDHNETSMRLSRALHRLGSTWAVGANLQRLDSQTYWAFEVPAPAAS